MIGSGSRRLTLSATVFAVFALFLDETTGAQPWERWLQVTPQVPGGFRRHPLPDPSPRGKILKYRFEARPSTLTRWAEELDREQATSSVITSGETAPPAFSEVSELEERLLESAIQDIAPWNATAGYPLDPELAGLVERTRAELERRASMTAAPEPVSLEPPMPMASIPTEAPAVYQIAPPQVTIIPASLASQLASYPELASQAFGQGASPTAARP